MFEFSKEPKSIFKLIPDVFRLIKDSFFNLLPILLIRIFIYIAVIPLTILAVFLFEMKTLIAVSSSLLILVMIILLITFGVYLFFYQMFQLIEYQKKDYRSSIKIVVRKMPRVLFSQFIAVVVFFIIPMALLFWPSLITLGAPVGSVVPPEVVSSFNNVIKLLTAISFLIGLIMTIYFMITLLFIKPLILLDDVGPIKAIGQTFKLIKGQWWRMFFLFLLIIVIISLPAALASYLVGLTKQQWLVMFLNVPLWLLNIYISPAVILIAYNDLKLRKKLS